MPMTLHADFMMTPGSAGKAVTWTLIAALLNVLLLGTSGGMVMAIPMEHQQPACDRTAQADISPCHEQMSAPSDPEQVKCGQSENGSCDYGCSSCAQTHYGMLVHFQPRRAEVVTFFDVSSQSFSAIAHAPVSPPPKRFHP